MNNFEDFKRRFSNHRQWREFIGLVHESVTYPRTVTYPKVIGALRSGRAWFNDGAARATSWLTGQTEQHESLCADEPLNFPERTKA
ncbi:MAG TPA: hypothetical protein VKG63_18515 [Steroidobacteraceae bacterium]|nr:hypothetical protein [Steroidobacteraceae bacterium]